MALPKTPKLTTKHHFKPQSKRLMDQVPPLADANSIMCKGSELVISYSVAGSFQGLVEIPDNIVDGFQAHGHADHVRTDSGGDLFLIVELPVGGGGWVDDQGFGVADVGQVAHESGRVDKGFAGGDAALDAEGQYRAGAFGHIALHQAIVRIVLKPRVIDPANPRVRLEVLGHRQSVQAVAIHSHRQGLDALQKLQGIEGAQAGAEGAHDFATGPHGEAEIAEGLKEAHPVVALRRFRHAGEFSIAPVELAGFHQHPADGGAMATEPFGGRVNDDVRTVIEGPAQVR